MSNIAILHIGAPIVLLLISVFTYIFVSIEIKKRRIEFKDIVSWFIVNTIYTLCVLYILVVEIVQFAFQKEIINIFSWITHKGLGIDLDGQEWILLLIFAFITFILVQVMITTIRVQRLKKNVDDLNKEVAILAGKVNKTADLNLRKVAKKTQSFSDLKSELREKIKIARANKKANEKLKLLSHTTEIDLKNKSKK